MASIASPSPVPKTATSSSDSSTLASYVTEYRIENGRRYHAYKDGAYWVSHVHLLLAREGEKNTPYTLTESPPHPSHSSTLSKLSERESPG